MREGISKPFSDSQRNNGFITNLRWHKNTHKLPLGKPTSNPKCQPPYEVGSAGVCATEYVNEKSHFRLGIRKEALFASDKAAAVNNRYHAQTCPPS